MRSALLSSVSLGALVNGFACFRADSMNACESISQFATLLGWHPVGGCVERTGEILGFEVVCYGQR